MLSATWSAHPRNVCAKDSNVADSALTEAERRLLLELNARGVRFILVGASAAVLQGANTATQDIDLWFESTSDPGIKAAVDAVGGTWVSGSFGMMPPTIGGEALGDRLDVVVHMHGLDAFDVEFSRAHEMMVEGVAIRVLPLERIIVSKRATGRSRDHAQLPALEEALAAATIPESDEPES
jgi:predicted nucleotidyltransferase